MVHNATQQSSIPLCLLATYKEGEITGGTVLELIFYAENMQKKAYL